MHAEPNITPVIIEKKPRSKLLNIAWSVAMSLLFFTGEILLFLLDIFIDSSGTSAINSGNNLLFIVSRIGVASVLAALLTLLVNNMVRGKNDEWYVVYWAFFYCSYCASWFVWFILFRGGD